MRLDAYSDRVSSTLRSMRHSPCLMSPISAIIILLLGAFSLYTMLIRIPEMIIGFLLAPLFSKSQWIIEFLYPLGLGRWGHLFLVRMSSKKKKEPFHSRTLEQRIEVISGRLYIHPIPQLLDNLAYLVVAIPEEGNEAIPLVAFVVDCGDARELQQQVTQIRQRHYDNRQIQIQSILCTHKHHDHTAGNRGLLESSTTLAMRIYGGACERVPYYTHGVANGDGLKLPMVEGNDMNAIVEVEVIAVPGHTRGSVAYSLRSRSTSSSALFMFTGDTFFSGGGGVPFEADFESPAMSRWFPKKAGSYVRPSAGNNAVERCFVEIVCRACQHGNTVDGGNVLIFPGHEYTSELLNRQFQPSAGESSHWNKFTPAMFFRTAGHLYVTNHRRSLPQGKILTVPSLLSLERDINPNLRHLRKRGEDIIRAVQCWYRLFSRGEISDEGKGFVVSAMVTANGQTNKSLEKWESSEEIWNVAVEDIAKPIFTAVYTADLDLIVKELESGKVKNKDLLVKIKSMRGRTEEPVVNRRPIPGTLPTDKVMYSAILAFAVIGSPPSAMTISDATNLKIPAPVAPFNTHMIGISKKRVIDMLKFLGLIGDDVAGRDLTNMIHLLWKESVEYGKSDDDLVFDSERLNQDEVELGVIRWMLFGIEANQPNWFEKYCMPCGAAPPRKLVRDHPVNSGVTLRRTNGELVKHDALTCPLCRDVTGCPLSDGGTGGQASEVDPEQEPDRNSSPNVPRTPSDSRRILFPVGLSPPAVREVRVRSYASATSRPFDETTEDAVELQIMSKGTF